MKNGIKENSKSAGSNTVRHVPQLIFKIVIVHENLSAALRAKELADRLSAAFTQEIRSEIDYWKFDWLSWSPFREQAAEAANKADIVIFSASHNQMPPLDIQTWIESWLPGKQSDWSAVVALVGGGRTIPGEARRLSDYLHDLTVRTKTDFFCNVVDKAERVRQQAFESIQWQTQSRLRLRRESLSPGFAAAGLRLCLSSQ